MCIHPITHVFNETTSASDFYRWPTPRWNIECICTPYPSPLLKLQCINAFWGMDSLGRFSDIFTNIHVDSATCLFFCTTSPFENRVFFKLIKNLLQQCKFFKQSAVLVTWEIKTFFFRVASLASIFIPLKQLSITSIPVWNCCTARLLLCCIKTYKILINIKCQEINTRTSKK